MTQAHPLAWPHGWKRTSWRSGSKFATGRGDDKRKLTIGDGVKRVFKELALMGVKEDDVIISTNVEPRLGGGSSTSQGSNVSDPGVAVYWSTKGKPQRVIAIDRYHTVADNLAALAATLDAMRSIERHGGAVVMDRAFDGFAALPPPASSLHWSEVLNVPRDASIEHIRGAHRSLAMTWHPDKHGGTKAAHDKFAEINAAKDRAIAERTIS